MRPHLVQAQRVSPARRRDWASLVEFVCVVGWVRFRGWMGMS